MKKQVLIKEGKIINKIKKLIKKEKSKLPAYTALAANESLCKKTKALNHGAMLGKSDLINSIEKVINQEGGDMKLEDGMMVKGEIEGRDIVGVLHPEDGRWFLCQDEVEGGTCEDKKGFKHSWHLGCVGGEEHIIDFFKLEPLEEPNSNKSGLEEIRKAKMEMLHQFDQILMDYGYMDGKVELADVDDIRAELGYIEEKIKKETSNIK